MGEGDGFLIVRSHDLFIRPISRFTSGVGITYGPSALCVAPKEGAVFRFTDLVGYRLPPAHVVRASDWQPIHIHDVVPFSGNFTLIVFLVENLKLGFDSIQNVWMKYGQWIDTVLVKKGEKEEFFFEDDAYLMEPAFDGNRYVPRDLAWNICPDKD